jgi:hypothetical protein
MSITPNRRFRALSASLTALATLTALAASRSGRRV